MDNNVADFKMKKLEIDVQQLNRKVSEHDVLHIEARKDIDMLKAIHATQQQTNELIAEVIDYAKKTYEVFEPLAKFLSFSAKIAIVGTAIWHGIKLMALKIFAVQL